MNNDRVLMPKYMHTFHCIGPECEDNCCGGWQIEIDRKTYKKYKNWSNPEEKELLQNAVKRNKGKDVKDGNYAKIVLNDKGKCPLLTCDGLCRMHLNHGESAISEVCLLYPRVVNIFNGVFEYSTKLSCPESARQALLCKDGIDFEYTEMPLNDRLLVLQSIDPADENAILNKYFWDLREFSIEVVQNRTSPIESRLILLGMFYQKMNSIIEAKSYDSIPSAIQEYREKLNNLVYMNSINNIDAQHLFQLKLFLELIDAKEKRGIPNQVFIDRTNNTLTAFTELQEGEQLNEQKIIEQMKFGYQTYYNPIMKEHEYILENFIVNFMFEAMFPFSWGRSMFDNYSWMIVLFTLIKIQLLGTGLYDKELSVEKIVQVIYSTSRVVEHDPQFVQNILEAMKTHHFDSPAHIIMLIKH